MGAIIKVFIRACGFYILLSSCTIAVLATIFVPEFLVTLENFRGG